MRPTTGKFAKDEIEMELSPGETLAILRRRAGLSQAQMAENLFVSVSKYRRWERDLIDAKPPISLSKISKGEWCYVLRRRSGMTLDALSKAVGLSRVWILKAERNEVNPDALVKWWEMEIEDNGEG